jgi:hypothetical protein
LDARSARRVKRHAAAAAEDPASDAAFGGLTLGVGGFS